MEFKKGERREQVILFPESLEEYVEENSTVRVIDAYVNSNNLSDHGFNRWQPNETGRPPYDPKDILKLYIYGYLNRIRSSRRLETESKRNVEVMWLLGKLSPDHKTIARFRSDNPEALKNMFRDFVKMCAKFELYGKELASIDGSKFKAVNSKKRNFTQGIVKDRLERLDKKINEYFKELDENDRKEDDIDKTKTKEDIKKIIEELKERKITYQKHAEELKGNGETQKSLTDPESRLMPSNGKMDVCYNVQTAVDAKNKLIIGFEVTNHTNDMNQITPMAEQIKDVLEVETIAITGDKGYASVSDIAAAIQIGVDPHIAGTDYDICIPSQEDKSGEITNQTNGKCVYLKDRNIVLCPMGNILYPNSYNRKNSAALFYNLTACRNCACRCSTRKKGQMHQVTMHESAFSKTFSDKDLSVKQIHIKPDSKIYKQRKSIAEHPFGTVKNSMDGRYCLTKGKRKVTGEFALLFMAYNLKRVINILGSKKILQLMNR